MRSTGGYECLGICSWVSSHGLAVDTVGREDCQCQLLAFPRSRAEMHSNL